MVIVDAPPDLAIAADRLDRLMDGSPVGDSGGDEGSDGLGRLPAQRT
jgi:hypothetical protein